MKYTLSKFLGAAAICGLLMLTSAATARADQITKLFGGTGFTWFNNGVGPTDAISTTGGFWEQDFTNTGAGTTESITFHLHLADTLTTGFWENFTVFANNVDIGKFSVTPGESGELHLHFFYPAGITGPDFDFKFEMTSSTLPKRAGSVTLLFAHQPSTATISGSTPVPEPSPLWLLGLGMLGFVAVGARHRLSSAAGR